MPEEKSEQQADTKPMAAVGKKSKARRLQERVGEFDPKAEPAINITLRFDNPDQPDMHIQLPADAIYAILDPDVPDTFIRVEPDMPSAKGRYIHTKSIRELLYHSVLPERGGE